MALHPAKSFGERLGIAVVTAGSDLRAAANGIPCRVGPFDLGVFAHAYRSSCRGPIGGCKTANIRVRYRPVTPSARPLFSGGQYSLSRDHSSGDTIPKFSELSMVSPGNITVPGTLSHLLHRDSRTARNRRRWRDESVVFTLC